MSDLYPNLPRALANLKSVFYAARDRHYEDNGLPRISKSNGPHVPLSKMDQNAQFGFLNHEAAGLARVLLETKHHRNSGNKLSEMSRLQCSKAHRFFLYSLKLDPNSSSDPDSQEVYQALDSYLKTVDSLFEKDQNELIAKANRLKEQGLLAPDEKLYSKKYPYHEFVKVLRDLGLTQEEILDIWRRSLDYELKLDHPASQKSQQKPFHQLTKRERKDIAYREKIESRKKDIQRPESFLFNDNILEITRFIDHIIRFEPNEHDLIQDIRSKLKTLPLRDLVDTKPSLDANHRQFYFHVLEELQDYNLKSLTPVLKEIAQKALDKPFVDLVLKYDGITKSELVESCLRASKATLENYKFDRTVSRSPKKTFSSAVNNFTVIAMVEDYLQQILKFGPRVMNSLEKTFSKVNYANEEWMDLKRLVDNLNIAGGRDLLGNTDLITKFFELYIRGDRKEYFCWPERYNPKADLDIVLATISNHNGLGMFLHNVSLVKDPERKMFFLRQALDPLMSFRQAEANLNQYLFPVGNGYTNPKSHRSYKEYLSHLIGKSMRHVLPPFNIFQAQKSKVRQEKIERYIKFQQQGLATTTRATWLSESLHSLETDTHSHYHPAILSEFANVCARKSYLFYSTDRMNRPIVLDGLSPPKAFYIEGSYREAYKELNDLVDMVFSEGYFGHKRYSDFKNDLKNGFKDIQGSQIVHGNGFMMFIPPEQDEYRLPGKLTSKQQLPPSPVDDTHYSYLVFNKKNNTAPYQIAYLVPTEIAREFVQDYAVEMKDGIGARTNQKNFKDYNLTISRLEKKAKERGLLILNLGTPANLSALAVGSYPIEGNPYQPYNVSPEHRIMPNAFGNVRLISPPPDYPKAENNRMTKGLEYLAGTNTRRLKNRIINAQDHLYKKYSRFQGLADAYLILLSQWHRGITLERRFSDYMLNRAKIIHDHFASSQANSDEYPILISTNTITGGNSLELRTWLDTKDLTLHTFENGSGPTEYQEYTYDPLDPQEFTDRFLTAFSGERGLGVDLTNDIRFVSRSEFENIIRNKGVRKFED